MPKSNTNQGYTLALRRATGELSWYQLTPPDGAQWIHRPFADGESPSLLPLKEVDRVMSEMDIEDHYDWMITDPQNRTTEIYPNQYKEEEEGRGWSLLLLIYCFLLASLVALALFWNVQPFITFIKVIATKVDFAEISRFLFSLPGIGGFFLWVANFYAALLGSMLYAIFQVIELTPYFYRRNPVRMRQTIAAWTTWATFKVGKKDPRAVRSLKRSYNEHPLKLYKNLSTARNVVYAFELAVCFIAEPPVKDGNPFTFLGYLITLQFGKIDWLNVLLMLSVLFLVDGLVRFTLAIVPEIFPKTEA